MVNVKLGIVVRESPCFEEYAIDSAVSSECPERFAGEFNETIDLIGR